MKLFKKCCMAAAIAAMVLMAGCSNAAGGSNPPAPPIGSKAPAEAKAVGDIVFKDGSAEPYVANMTLTQAQKDAAIAVIFYAGGTGLNNNSDTTTTRTLGVGLKHHPARYWCTKSANAYNIKITTIQCTASGSAGALTFTGDKNGSDNLEQIASFLPANSSTDDTATEPNYPAFYWAKNYKTTATNIAGTNYESGWYLPSLAELFEIWKQKATVDAASNLCGDSQFGVNNYWSSSQSSDTASARYLQFSDGDWNGQDKEYNKCVCAVREF